MLWKTRHMSTIEEVCKDLRYLREVHMIYETKAGDVWDQIAHDTMGSTDYTTDLMRANTAHIRVSVFPKGVQLVIPEVTRTVNVTAAPWRRDEA